MARLRGGRGWGCARSSLSVGLPQAGGAMCGYQGKRRARSLTRRVDCFLDVRGESVVPLPSLPSGDLQGDASSSKRACAPWPRDVHASRCRRDVSRRVYVVAGVS